jgi:hypothetical protein
MQQQTVDHAEDDDVGGDGHGEGEDRGEGEAERPAQLAKRVAKILEERVHGLPSRVSRIKCRMRATHGYPQVDENIGAGASACWGEAPPLSEKCPGVNTAARKRSCGRIGEAG